MLIVAATFEKESQAKSIRDRQTELDTMESLIYHLLRLFACALQGLGFLAQVCNVLAMIDIEASPKRSFWLVCANDRYPAAVRYFFLKHVFSPFSVMRLEGQPL